MLDFLELPLLDDEDEDDEDDEEVVLLELLDDELFVDEDVLGFDVACAVFAVPVA